MTYRGEITPQVTAQYYHWLATADTSPRLTYGVIIDFREVTVFYNTNLSTVQRASQKANTTQDLSHIPIALIVSNLYQEQLLRISMKITPQEHRKQIVKSVICVKNSFAGILYERVKHMLGLHICRIVMRLAEVGINNEAPRTQ